MRCVRSIWAGVLLSAPFALAATFGTVVPVIGGASDLVVDEGRGRLYLVNTAQTQLQIYSVAQKRFLTPVTTDASPLSAAISRSGKYLYVTCSTAAALDVVDLDALALVNRVTLPAQPEGVAVGADERVLISTIGTGAGNTANVLLLYDPNATGGSSLASLPIAPPAPQSPLLPPPSGRPFLSGRSELRASPDGSLIVGANLPNANSTVVFVYQVASATVLLSRTVSAATNVLAIAPDNSRFMAGITLFDTGTLGVLAQENLANALYPFQTTTNFNTTSAQGGSVFSPDGSLVYAAFDVSPVANPPVATNVSQLMFNDPDNLLIQLGLQLPENLAGKMSITADGSTIYALSDSGFTIIPVGSTFRNPIAVPDLTALALVSDQCGVNARTARATLMNAGQGRMTASAQLLQIASTGGLTPSPATAPSVKPAQTPGGPAFDFTFNPSAATGLGTTTPPHDFLVQSPEAINIPPRIRVFENSRNAEATGTLVPIPTGASSAQQLEDLLYDSRRRRIYIANSGLNRVEVYDLAQQTLLAPIKVGQLPRSMALTPDGNTLYVGSAGGELISLVDPDAMKVTGKVTFPPLPFNSGVGLVTPSSIAAGVSGLLIAMSDGSLWSVVGNSAVPRGPNAIIGSNAAGRPNPLTAPFSMASTPAGEYIVVLNGNGTVYLYDARAGNFVQARSVFSGAISGYFGPITAGPGGQYYAINGVLLNAALNPIVPAPTAAGPGTGAGAPAPVPIAAMAQVSGTSYARFSLPMRSSTTALPNAAPVVELVDVPSGRTLGSFPAVEGPPMAISGTGRGNIEGRTMAVDTASATAYILTASGLSVVSLAPIQPGSAPQIFSKGVVDAISFQPKFAQNGLISIFGQNLGTMATPSNTPLPVVLGGVCVTLGTTPMPLFLASPGQINAQIPPSLGTGNYPLVVRAIGQNLATGAQTIAISKYAPAVVVDPVSNQAAVLHADGQFVTKDNPANRDEPLTMYATGMGLPTKVGAVTAGVPSPSSPLAVTQPVNVYFGNPAYKQAGIIVDFSGLAPGFVGLYQLNLRVPGFHISGEALPITLKIGGISSPGSGPVLPVIAVN